MPVNEPITEVADARAPEIDFDTEASAVEILELMSEPAAMVVVKVPDPAELVRVVRIATPPPVPPRVVVRVPEPAELVRVVTLPTTPVAAPGEMVVVRVPEPAELVRVVATPVRPEPEMDPPATTPRVVVKRPFELLPVLTTTVAVPDVTVAVAVTVAVPAPDAAAFAQRLLP